MNIILANVRKKNPAVHKANEQGQPLCGAKHREVTVRSSDHSSCRVEPEADGQFEFQLSDDRCQPKEKLKPEKVKPFEEYIEDIGDITCKSCLKKMEEHEQQ